MHRRGWLAPLFACCVLASALPARSDEPVRAPDGAERQAIGEYIREHLSALRGCYERRIRNTPTLSGRLMARFDITPTGTVERATADGMPDPELVHCVVDEITKWQFSRSEPGRLRVAYPLVFHQG